MNKLLIALMAALFLAGCASTGSTSSSLPEIAPYDEPAVTPMPDNVPAHQLGA